MAWLKRICAVAAFLVVAFFGFLLSLDNATPVALRILHRETAPQPVYWWLYAAFAGGLVFGLAMCLSAYLRWRFAERRLRRTLREREAELARLPGSARPGNDTTASASEEAADSVPVER